MAPQQEVALITGVSSGLGTALAVAALAAGHHVIGTVRSRQRASEEVEAIELQGGKCLELDVTDADACRRVLQEAEEVHGRVDHLINNAGMSWLGAVEDYTDVESRQQMEFNFYGPLRLMQAALPGFRRRQSGSIVNVSSVAAIHALPSCGLYSASKFALEGLSESLAAELNSYNVRVLIAQPRAFRTNFLGAYKLNTASNLEHYPAATSMIERFKTLQGSQPGDAEKAAARIVEAISKQGLAGEVLRNPQGRAVRLPLGSDCVKRYELKVETLWQDLRDAREASLSTDLDELVKDAT